jgi:hypothetical protein
MTNILDTVEPDVYVRENELRRMAEGDKHE